MTRNFWTWSLGAQPNLAIFVSSSPVQLPIFLPSKTVWPAFSVSSFTLHYVGPVCSLSLSISLYIYKIPRKILHYQLITFVKNMQESRSTIEASVGKVYGLPKSTFNRESNFLSVRGERRCHVGCWAIYVGSRACCYTMEGSQL